MAKCSECGSKEEGPWPAGWHQVMSRVDDDLAKALVEQLLCDKCWPGWNKEKAAKRARERDPDTPPDACPQCGGVLTLETTLVPVAPGLADEDIHPGFKQTGEQRDYSCPEHGIVHTSVGAITERVSD